MKLMIASDIHGSLYYCDKMLKSYREENAQRLVLLGDLLYHGPRNDLPRDYNPKEVIKRLNEVRSELIAIRGNCDAEVDQMVLEFPIMADMSVICLENRIIYASHGHIYSTDNLPPLKSGDIFLQGHTHIPMAKEQAGVILLNPGSVSIPKENNPHSYGIIDNEVFSVKSFEGEIIKQIKY